MSGTVVGAAEPRPARALRTVHLSPSVFGVLIVAVFTGTIGLAMATGTWQLTGRPATGGGGGPGGVPQGQAVTEVKGWMPVGDVAEAGDVPLAELLAAFGLPADTPPSTSIKELESETFSVPALREWLAGRPPASSAPPSAEAP